jgi:hypothetical protein
LAVGGVGRAFRFSEGLVIRPLYLKLKQTFNHSQFT